MNRVVTIVTIVILALTVAASPVSTASPVTSTNGPGGNFLTETAAQGSGSTAEPGTAFSRMSTSLTVTGSTTLVSVASDGTQANGPSRDASISADGRYVAFMTVADNLVPGDTNGYTDVFVHDRQTGQTSRVSVASDGAQANSWSGLPSISADGRYVAFGSNASNLISGDTNDTADVFVHDRATGQTNRVSVASDGTQRNGGGNVPSISADSRFVAFSSSGDVFVHDRQTGQTIRVSIATDGTEGCCSGYPAISADGLAVAFYSSSSNLVSDDTNRLNDVFVHDRSSGETTRVSVASDGTESNGHSDIQSISADGRFVTFFSQASNLVVGDTNNALDVFVHDRQSGETTRVSVATDGTEGNDASTGSAISADGRYVAFFSLADNLVNLDTNNAGDVFVHDRHSGETTRVSVATDGTEGSYGSGGSDISADGRFVAFGSAAANLVPNDTNDQVDIFVRDRGVVMLNVYLPLTLHAQ